MPTNLELLRQIEDDAISSKVPVTELLRRVQVFASRARLPELADWVRYELNGYPQDIELPKYRVIYGIAKGHFLGPFRSGLRNANLPASNLPEELRDWARKAYLRQPIAALEKIANDKGSEGDLSFPWPGDLVARVQGSFYEGMALAQAWLSVSRTDFVSAVDAVRNRILSFALEAEPLIAEDNAPTPQPATSAGLTQVFHNHIYGTVTNLAQGNESAVLNAGVAASDLAGLLQALTKLGVRGNDIEDLKQAIQADGPPQEKRFGSKVAGWIGKMVTKAASGAWSVTVSTAGSVLPKLLAAYYGMPPQE